MEEGTEGQLQCQVQAKENDLTQQPLEFDGHSTVNSEAESSAVKL